MYKRTFMQTLAAVAMMLLPAACADDYDDSALWDKVNAHEERLAALEKWQEQTNQSIAAMQELLNTTDKITGVGEDVAYVQTPQIGLAQAADGNWYWTLNGETLTDADGNPIRANGLDGADGEDGEITACYWSNYDGNGIGANYGTGTHTKVDGTTVIWQTAVDAMNAALQYTEWRYELTGALFTLKKQ